MSTPIQYNKVRFPQLSEISSDDELEENSSPQGATSSEASREELSPEEIERNNKARTASSRVFEAIAQAMNRTDLPSERQALICQILRSQPSENIGYIAHLAEEVAASCRGFISSSELPYEQHLILCSKYDEVINETNKINEKFEKLYRKYFKDSLTILSRGIPSSVSEINKTLDLAYIRQKLKLTIILLFKEWESKLDNLKMIEEVLYGKQKKPSEKLLMLQAQYEEKYRAFNEINEAIIKRESELKAKLSEIERDL